jgi:NAD(P)-dependent dehydrogenase (short-subunit alcohol dehydrogenase family)
VLLFSIVKKNFLYLFEKKTRALNMLFLNAAIFETDFRLSSDNIELMFQTNHLSQFYLTRLILHKMLNEAFARIVVISSEAHR